MTEPSVVCRLVTHMVTLTVKIGHNSFRKSPLPLTDPGDADAQRMLNIQHRIIW